MSFANGQSGPGALPGEHKKRVSFPASESARKQDQTNAPSQWSAPRASDDQHVGEDRIDATQELPAIPPYREASGHSPGPLSPQDPQAPPPPRFIPQRGHATATQEPTPTAQLPMVSVQPPVPPSPSAPPVSVASAFTSSPAPQPHPADHGQPLPPTEDLPSDPPPVTARTHTAAPPAASTQPPTGAQEPANAQPHAISGAQVGAPASSIQPGPYASAQVNPRVAPPQPGSTLAGFTPPTPPTIPPGQATAMAQPATMPPRGASQPYSGPQAGLYGVPTPSVPAGGVPAATAHTPTGAKPKSTVAEASLASGVLAFVSSWVPSLSILTYIFALAALILGIIGIVQTQPKGKYRGLGVAIAGCVLSFTPAIAAIALQALYFNMPNALADTAGSESMTAEQSAPSNAPEDEATVGLAQPDTNPQANAPTQGTPSTQISPDDQAPGTPSIPSPQDSEDLVESPELVAVGSGEIAEGKMLATIANASKAGPDDEGRPTVLVTIVLTNKHSRDTVTFLDADVSVYQNGESLEMSFYEKNAPRGYDSMAYVKDISPGETRVFKVPYALNDDRAPITVEIGSSFSEGKVAKDFSLR